MFNRLLFLDPPCKGMQARKLGYCNVGGGELFGFALNVRGNFNGESIVGLGEG